MTASKNRYELRQYLRFQLDQMSAKNQQHQFEELAFELARQTITRRVVPATGPVQAGGDQGRDFESYRTYLASTPIASSLSVAAEGNGTLVFACTLDKALTNRSSATCALFSAMRPNLPQFIITPSPICRWRNATIFRNFAAISIVRS